ncbi:MAG: Uma2 family endonuclease, partial [Ardenticatenaceae bacterium]
MLEYQKEKEEKQEAIQRAEQAELEKEQEKLRAEQAEQQKELERKEKERLAAILKRLGISFD